MHSCSIQNDHAGSTRVCQQLFEKTLTTVLLFKEKQGKHNHTMIMP